MAIGNLGNGYVTVRKSDLIAKMKMNHAKHREMFLEAMAGYRKAAIEELDKMIQEAKDGKEIRRFVELEVPEDHSDEYSLVIDMLTWSTSDEIDITQTQFNNFVRDQWGWSNKFISSNAVYTGKAK
jgi:hypothetical protein